MGFKPKQVKMNIKIWIVKREITSNMERVTFL